MSALRPKLPNMNALLPFEAAGRWLSFTRAAEEFCVTQGAVSRQIRELELSLGVALFRRGHRSIELTDDGRRYHHAVTVALEHLVDATGDVVARPSERQVTVAATSAISIYWLMPLLPLFQSMFPDITVQVLASDPSLASAPDAFDIGIQFGHEPVVFVFALAMLMLFGRVFSLDRPAWHVILHGEETAHDTPHPDARPEAQHSVHHV